MRALLIAAVVALGLAPQVQGQAQDPAQAPAPQGPKIQITFEPNGLVTLVANGATLREILAEWSRQGGSTFVNSERLSGGPQILQYEHQPETVVMSSILRQAAGFVLGPRREGTRGASSFEVVYILATSNPSAGGYVSQPTMPQPQQPQISTTGSPDSEIAPVQGRGAPGPQPVQAPPPSNDYRPAVPSVAVPIVAQPPTTTTTPPATTQPPATTGSGAAGSI